MLKRLKINYQIEWKWLNDIHLDFNTKKTFHWLKNSIIPSTLISSFVTVTAPKFGAEVSFLGEGFLFECRTMKIRRLKSDILYIVCNNMVHRCNIHVTDSLVDFKDNLRLTTTPFYTRSIMVTGYILLFDAQEYWFSFSVNWRNVVDFGDFGFIYCFKNDWWKKKVLER